MTRWEAKKRVDVGDSSNEKSDESQSFLADIPLGKSYQKLEVCTLDIKSKEADMNLDKPNELRKASEEEKIRLGKRW